MNFLQLAAAPIAVAFSKCASVAITPVLKPNRTPGFDYQCNDVMSVAASAGMKPRELADLIVSEIKSDPMFADVSVGGPGFINLKLASWFVEKQVLNMRASVDLGIEKVSPDQLVVIDFGGPNVAKPLHVGHLRSFVIGESLRRILKAVGYDVVSDIHWGDWGLQMGMLLHQISQQYPDDWAAEAVPEFDVHVLEEMYRIASKAAKEDGAVLASARNLTQKLQAGDPYLLAVWKEMREVSLSSISGDITKLQAHFDLMLGESDVNDALPAMLAELEAKGLSRVSDGALVVDVAEGQPPLIVQKSDGAALYGATDLATVVQRTKGMGASKILYVVDQRQEQHLQSVFEVARKAGFDHGAELAHVAFGTVNGKDGKPFKTRDGGVAKLTDLLASTVEQAKARVSDGNQEIAEKIAIGALKFADLSTDRISGYIFDPERMTAPEGKTGPYLQYACARIRSVVAKAATLPSAGNTGEINVEHEAERQLLLTCVGFPMAVQAASDRYQPKEVAEFAFSVAQAFSRFYSECQVVFDGKVNASRLAICQFVEVVLSECLYLLGIEVPERM